MRYGNCLIGVILLAIRHRFRGRVLKIRRPNQPVPHLLYRANGKTWHFKVEKDLLPGEWRYYWFKGRIEEAVHERDKTGTPVFARVPAPHGAMTPHGAMGRS